MSGAPILFAVGEKGAALTPPERAQVLAVERPVNPAAPLSEAQQRALVQAALDKPVAGPPLRELAKGKRRAVILAGDLARPAPYDIVLPAIVEALVAAEIRPSRIALAACPGGCGPLLGRAAIHRYGEEFCGEHEAVAWPDGGTPGTFYDSADLRIAIAPHLAGAAWPAFLAGDMAADFALELTLGNKAAIDIESARAFSPFDKNAADANHSSATSSDVWIGSGGGSPWEETLEEALLSLHHVRTDARTAVLFFSGAEGLGSARFARDIWSLIQQAEEILASGGRLGDGPAAPSVVSNRFDPATALASALSRYSTTVLLAPDLAGHSDGEELAERLDAATHVASRLVFCASEKQLWDALAVLHAGAFTLHAEPLGWRGR